jgi:hypothetical protein
MVALGAFPLRGLFGPDAQASHGFAQAVQSLMGDNDGRHQEVLITESIYAIVLSCQ